MINTTTEERDPTMTMITIAEAPVKGEATMTPDEVQKQAELARGCLVAVSEDSYGTCGDERPRVGLLSGEATVEPRPSTFGGPNIYGLYVTELSGYFGDSSASVEDRISMVTKDLQDKNKKSGGHVHCAANDSFGPIVGIIANNGDDVKAYAKSQLGEEYDEETMDQVLGFAQSVDQSGRYEDHEEKTLFKVLGDEAGTAIEHLADVPHEGRTIVRNHVKGHTVDQTKLHEVSDGEDSFVFDDWDADIIETALASGPDPVKMRKLMKHAREAVIAGVAQAVPNKEIHQITLR